MRRIVRRPLAVERGCGVRCDTSASEKLSRNIAREVSAVGKEVRPRFSIANARHGEYTRWKFFNCLGSRDQLITASDRVFGDLRNLARYRDGTLGKEIENRGRVGMRAGFATFTRQEE